MSMELVRCITGREYTPELTVGKKYWIDESSLWKDSDGDEYAEVYTDEKKSHKVGNLLTSHFETIYRYLNHGGSLSSYINTHTGFLLKDIISWCIKEGSNQLAEKLILYIHDNKLDLEENMEKEFIVNHIPFNEFAERGEEEKYSEYLGYYLYCID